MKTFRLSMVQEFIVFIGLFSLVAVQMHNFADDPGVGWHLKTGELIVETGSIPDRDPFLSFTEDRDWVSDQWLSDVLLFGLYSAGSWPLVYGALAVLFLIIFFLFLYRGAVKLPGSSFIASSFAILLAFKLAQVHFILRPVMFGFLLFTLVYLRIFKLSQALMTENSQSKWREIKYSCYYLPPVFLVWANLHPSFVLGLFFMSLLPIALVGERILFGKEAIPAIGMKLVGSLLSLLALCTLATFINPYFFELHRSIFALGGNEFFMNYHMEWQSPDFKAFEGLLLQIALLTIAISYFASGKSSRRLPVFEFLIVAVFAILATRSVRMLPYFGIVASFPLMYALVNLKNIGFFSSSSVGKRLAKAFKTLEGMESRGLQGKLLLVVLSILLIFSSVFYASVPGYSGYFGPDKQKFPYQALQHLELKHSQRAEPVTLLSTPAWGGFITFKGEASKAVIDDRNTMLGEEFYRRYHQSLTDPVLLKNFADELNARYVLLPAGWLISKAVLANGLAEIEFEDDVAIVLRWDAAI